MPYHYEWHPPLRPVMARLARLARLVVPGLPHHVTQRGNRRQQTFFSEADYALYRALLVEFATKAGVAVWASCLMPNHVHLILVPTSEGGLATALGEAHRRYTRHVNVRESWRGFVRRHGKLTHWRHEELTPRVDEEKRGVFR